MTTRTRTTTPVIRREPNASDAFLRDVRAKVAQIRDRDFTTEADWAALVECVCTAMEQQWAESCRELTAASRLLGSDNNTAMTLGSVRDEIARQDKTHPKGFPCSRDGLRSGIAAIEDETREALEAWRSGRAKTTQWEEHWADLATELIQIAAVAVRTARGI